MIELLCLFVFVISSIYRFRKQPMWVYICQFIFELAEMKDWRVCHTTLDIHWLLILYILIRPLISPDISMCINKMFSGIQETILLLLYIISVPFFWFTFLRIPCILTFHISWYSVVVMYNYWSHAIRKSTYFLNTSRKLDFKYLNHGSDGCIRD